MHSPLLLIAALVITGLAQEDTVPDSHFLDNFGMPQAGNFPESAAFMDPTLVLAAQEDFVRIAYDFRCTASRLQDAMQNMEGAQGAEGDDWDRFLRDSLDRVLKFMEDAMAVVKHEGDRCLNLRLAL